MHDRYHVITGPPLSPPTVSAEALQGLASALNALEDPVGAAVNELTADMVELAFNSLPPTHRQKLLGNLGIRIAAPRRAGRALCQDVLSRLRRDARQHKCRCGISDLTTTVMNQIGEAVFAQDDNGETVSDPVSRWGATLIRTTVFAWCNASVFHAHVLAWTADRDWFTELADEDQAVRLAAVADAARSARAAYPDLEFLRKGLEQSSAGDSESAVLAVPESGVPSELPAATGDEAWDEAGGTEGLDPEAACREVQSALAAARQAAENATSAVADGCPPHEDDLTALGTLGAAFDSADAVFRAAGITRVPRRLEDMTRAAREHRTTRERDREARKALRELHGVASLPDSSPAALAAQTVRAETARLLDAATWEQPQRQEAAALTDLGRLLRKGRQAYEAAEILALQDRVVQVLPGCAMAVLVADHLVLARPEAAAKPPETKGQPTADTTEGAAGAADEPPVADTTADPVQLLAEQTDERPVKAPVDRASEGRRPRADHAPQAPVAKPEADPATTDDTPTAQAAAHEPTALAAAPEATTLPAAPALYDGEALPVEPARQAPAATSTGTATANATEVDADAAATDRVLTHLVVERRFGLAHQVAFAAGHPEPQVVALRLAGAAGLLTPGDSQGARLTADLLQQYGGHAGRDAEGSELILLPALLRTALITGDHMAGAQLKALAPRLPERLGEAATAVADRALSGALLTASPLAVSADISGAEARLRELLEQCRIHLLPPRLRFARATDIAKQWLADDGLLGSMLRTVAADDRDGAARVREQAERLSKLPDINNEIDRMDRKHRSPSGKPLQGSGRKDLVHLVERVAALAKEWCLVVDTIRRGDRSDSNRAVKEISSLRRSLLDGREAALGELLQLAQSSGAVNGATAWAAHASMDELFNLLAGKTAAPLAENPVDPELVLDVELLKVCDRVDERPPLARLLTAVERSWQDALAERLALDAFAAARTLVELAGRGLLPGPQPGALTLTAVAEIDARAASRRAELREKHRDLVAELHRAQADGAVTDDQDLSLQELLADAVRRLDDSDTYDLVDVRRALDTVRDALPEFRKQAADRIRARLDALDPGEELRAQVLRHLDTGGLATAADLVYFLEIGEEVPEIDAGESHLTDFFPTVPDGLPKGIDQALVDLVRSGGTHPEIPVLDYSALSTDEAALAADALQEWRALGATEPKDRLEVSARRQLLPALKLLGYDAKSAKPLDERSHRRREYRLFEATEVEINGRAKAPAFGSQIREQGGTLRVLLVWGRPPAKVVMSLAESDTSGTSLLVAYFGTLSRGARIELAAGSSQLQPMLVVDDAALAYLAARGNRQVSTATQTLLPFSGVNPYIREKRGRIGGEMFYGRDAERKSVLDPLGTQVIFGGRGLGKSALLSDAGERFEGQRPGYQLAVYVNLDQENIGKGSSLGLEALWSVLDRELRKAEVLVGQQGRKSVKDMSERVRAGIGVWLDGDSRRRLLILLDECDQFFEADAPRFDQTKKLKGLGTDTKDRAKVVFAGLHSVQRFTKLASNGPFSHLAQTPKVIGPLAPQSAAELLVDPMRALGFEFQDMDLVNRVLGYCSYQPFLLQMFGHRLVELMHRKRMRRGTEGPPYAVEIADIEGVESDTGLRDSISAAFKDTLSLDHRYDVIANVLAYHARHRGLEVRLSDAELREECETFWRRGFEQLDTEGFRAYLSEMVGLGVLAPNHDGQGWHLRGPNALRMIGTSHEVDARLLRAEQDCELQESIVQEGRPELPDGRPAPLTITQLDDLLGERSNQTRIVLGTAATGVGDVGDTLRAIAGRIADWTLPAIGKPSVYKQELTGGRPRERRVVISDFARYPDARPEAPRQAVDQAETMLPTTPGVTRAVVVVTDPSQLGLWRPLLTGTEPTSAAPVVLRRHDRGSLRGWAQRVEKFHTEDRLDRLHELTGGWPVLVDRAHRLHGELSDPDAALHRLAGLRRDRVAARSFVEATGVYADPLLATGYRALDEEFKETLFDLESAVAAIALRIEDEDEARWVVTCLDALQVLDRQENHLLRLEPLLRECVALLD
ncbi:hypothetical protein ABTX80_04335 [Streptomyces erythrochromogenes]|uniref:hypothetical protein n=2 Tax=Streptomyces erythrochromogenes TaxID=285574 RepID=UPI00333035CC